MRGDAERALRPMVTEDVEPHAVARAVVTIGEDQLSMVIRQELRISRPLLEPVWLFGRKTANRIQVGAYYSETESAEQRIRIWGAFVLTIGLARYTGPYTATTKTWNNDLATFQGEKRTQLACRMPW